jgi:hypothetical protein
MLLRARLEELAHLVLVAGRGGAEPRPVNRPGVQARAEASRVPRATPSTPCLRNKPAAPLQRNPLTCYCRSQRAVVCLSASGYAHSRRCKRRGAAAHLSHLTSTCPSAYASASDGSAREAPRTAAAAIAVARACDTRERGPTATTQGRQAQCHTTVAQCHAHSGPVPCPRGRQAGRIDPLANAGGGVCARTQRQRPLDGEETRRQDRRANWVCSAAAAAAAVPRGRCAGARQSSASALSDG